MNFNKKNKVLKIIQLLVIIIFIIAIIGMLVISLVFKNENSTPKIFGYNLYIMNGTNMEPAIPDGSAVISKLGSLGNTPIGSVALCNIVENELTAILRIVSVETDEMGNVFYIAKNDTSPSTDVIRISSDKVIGEAIYSDELIGIILRFSTSQIGLILVVISPCFLLIIYQLFMIFKKRSAREELTLVMDLKNSKPTDDDEDIAIGFGKHKYEAPKQPKERNPKESIPLNPIKKFEPSVNIPDDVVFKPTLPKLSIDNTGKAEYVKNVPTSNLDAFNKILPPIHNNSQVAKSANTPQFTNINTPKPKETPKEISDILYEPVVIKSFSEDKEKDLPTYIAPVKLKPFNSSIDVESVSNNFTEKAIAPKPKKQSTNNTLEELMKLLDKEESKLRNKDK